MFLFGFYWLFTGFDTVPMGVLCRTTCMTYGQFCIYTGDRGGDSICTMSVWVQFAACKFWLSFLFICQWCQCQLVVPLVQNKLVPQPESASEILLPQINFLIPLFSVTYFFLCFVHPEVSQSFLLFKLRLESKTPWKRTCIYWICTELEKMKQIF